MTLVRLCAFPFGQPKAWVNPAIYWFLTTQFEGADLLRAAHTHFKSPALTQCVLAVAGPVSTTARPFSDQYRFVFRAGVGTSGHWRHSIFPTIFSFRLGLCRISRNLCRLAATRVQTG